MPESYLIELSHRDELPDIVRKCNANFKSVMFSTSSRASRSSASGDWEPEIDDLRQEMNSSFNEVAQELQSLESKITALKAALTPPVGAMMFCDADPSLTYEGTVWTEVSGGTMLMSAGSTYTEGSQWKLVDHTGTAVSLSSNGSLVTACRLWKRTA